MQPLQHPENIFHLNQNIRDSKQIGGGMAQQRRVNRRSDFVQVAAGRRSDKPEAFSPPSPCDS
jgi:hypothetical protein